jgi:hypothetical protein
MVELELGLFLPHKSKLELGSSKVPSTKKKNKKQERKKKQKKGIERKKQEKNKKMYLDLGCLLLNGLQES